jgi:hypothetical protein
MQRILCAALAALAFFLLPPAGAEARDHTQYRVKCTAAYCWPVAEPARVRKTAVHRKAWTHRTRRAARHVVMSVHKPHVGKIVSRTPDAQPASFGGSAPVAVARRYLGGNPTGWARVWCGAFMRLVMRAAGYPDLPTGNLATAWARYGRASAPQPGAVVVWPHHVGLITAVHRNGLATVISGNDGHRVRERVLSIAGAVVRMPG